MVGADDKWTETDSRTFIDIADVAIVGRNEANAMLVSLVPAETSDTFRLVDIGCGPGNLLKAVLEHYQGAWVTGVDGSAVMRAEATRTLAPFSERAILVPGDIHDGGWMEDVSWPVRCITSSLAIHHVGAAAKRSLFRDLASRLEPGGALLICDVVEATNEIVQRSFAEQWHRIAREQSLALTGSTATYERAVADGWARPETLEPEPGEMPSRLYEQLEWLREAGLGQVDCFWMRAGIAVYGGYR
jgi:tRNA (cmo5U34)-methyltransferase